VAVYRKPIDLEHLEAYLRGRGFRSTILTVKAGVQQLEVLDRRGRYVIDQAGNLAPASGSYATIHPQADAFAADLGAAIKDFRNG
jgi:hypothetical protein